MAGPSYYFTLHKKLQILGHVPESSQHGNGAGGLDLRNPAAVFGSSNAGALLGPTNAPAASPLWAILNSRAMGNAGWTSVDVGGLAWPTMPLGNGSSPPSWAEFQVNAPNPKLVTVLADWISAGKVNDVPGDVLKKIPNPVARPVDGVVPFACNMPGDDGVAPIPAKYWSTSLIFLVDPATGHTVFPADLAASDELFLVAVVGNRGTQDAGRYAEIPGPKIEVEAHVMVWNSGMSPAVKLPALSNLDADATSPVYESYFLSGTGYDVVGFRLAVQVVFDGLVEAVGQSGADLGGLTPEQWVLNHPAHLCAKVRIRSAGQSWPALGDPPTTERRIAQRNLAPFAPGTTVEDPQPAIEWHNFMSGDAFRLWRFHDEWGALGLRIDTQLRPDVAEFFLAIPTRTYRRLVKPHPMAGFRVEPDSDAFRAPFPDCVVLRLVSAQNRIGLGRLAEGEYTAMSLGILVNRERLESGSSDSVSVIQDAVLPKVVTKGSFENQTQVTGGFTIAIDAAQSPVNPRAAAT
jgi:hypothetical protein